MKTVLRFKHATWNVGRLGEKEEELDKTININNIKTSECTESKNKLQGTRQNENYVDIPWSQ
jgi:hypothetical protein